MKLACMTSVFAGDPIETAIVKIAEAGYRYVELSSVHCDYNTMTNALIDNVAHEISRAGLEVVAYYPADAEENWTRMPRMFEVASRLGASRVVAECANLSKARELEPLCQKFQIDLAIANQWPYPFGRPSDYSGLNGSVGSRIGAGPDTGWFAAGGQDPAELFDIAGDRIKVVHLKDVAAEGEYRPVDLGDGVARLAPFMAGLAEQGFDGPLTVARDPGKRITFDIGIFGDATYEVHEEAVPDDEVMRSLRQARTWALEHGAVE